MITKPVKPNYLLIIRKGIPVDGPKALFGRRLADFPDDLKQWIADKDASLWPCFRQMRTHWSLSKANIAYHVPEGSREPTCYCLHEFDADEVKEFRSRWPEVFVDAIPVLTEEVSVDWWHELDLHEDEED